MTVKIANVQGYALTRPAMGAKLSNIQGYALMFPPAPIRLRSVGGYAMVALPLSINLRSINGYAMASYNALPKALTPAATLMAMILTQAKTARPASHFNLDVVEVGTLSGYNSKVKLTPTASALLSGEMYFHYNRIYLNRIPDLSGVVIGGATQVSALIAKINTATGMLLVASDFVDDVIPANATELTLTAAATSYIWQPGTQVQLGNTVSLPSLFKTDTILWT